MEEFVRGIDRLYEPSRFLARIYRYFLNMWLNRKALARQARKDVPSLPQTRQGTDPFPSFGVQSSGPLMRLLWRQGIRPSYRWQFWRQLLGIYRQNPSRLKLYLMCCSMGEDLFALRRNILKEWHG